MKINFYRIIRWFLELSVFLVRIASSTGHEYYSSHTLMRVSRTDVKELINLIKGDPSLSYTVKVRGTASDASKVFTSMDIAFVDQVVVLLATDIHELNCQRQWQKANQMESYKLMY